MKPMDTIAFEQLREYHAKHGKYPQCLEVTEETLKRMHYRSFHFPAPLPAEPRLNMMSTQDVDSQSPMFEITRVPVCHVGDYVMTETGDTRLEVEPA